MTCSRPLDDIPAEIESELEQVVNDERLPGLSVGIVVDQELAWSRGLGTRDLATGEPADEHTLHRVASITKTLTTAAVLQLRDRRRLSLDDPLERHLPEFAEALVELGELPQTVTLCTDDDTSAGLPPMPATPRVVVSRTRPPAEAEQVRAALDGELVEMGSAGAKVMSVIRGESDCYPHSGGQYEWDSCAPAAVAAHYGLHVSRIDGSPMVYNRADPYLPDLLVCRPELAEASLAAIADG